MSASRTRVALLYGGRSAEHAVSVVSARSVMAALDPDRFDVVPVAITRAGAWLRPSVTPDLLVAPDGQLPEVPDDGEPVVLRPGPHGPVLAAVGPAGLRPVGDGHIDVVFPLLHGPLGEDGTVQGLLELADLPYVGPGVLASALAMDKAMTKVVCDRAGIPQVPYVLVDRAEWTADPAAVRARITAELALTDAGRASGAAVFVKPARMGSSIGISRVTGGDTLGPALEEAFAHDHKVLVEQGVHARELECGVLGLDRPEASVVGEIVPVHDFYDFQAKYLAESKLVVPADVPADVTERVRDTALRAFAALGCEGMARVDCFYEEHTGRVLLNEVNTIPGFTPRSMFPVLWEATGLPYPDLVARLVDLATERHARRHG